MAVDGEIGSCTQKRRFGPFGKQKCIKNYEYYLYLVCKDSFFLSPPDFWLLLNR